MFKCKKCKKKFISQYLLDKHLNREVPCDQKIMCELCNKIFQKKIELERHMQRKTPCVKVDKIKKSISLEIQQEKTKQEREKTRRELEKIKLKNEQIKLKNEQREKEIQLQKEKALAIEEKKMEQLKFDHEKKLEKMLLQKEKELTIENIKTERKEKTTTIINNDNRQQIINNIQVTINNIFPAENIVDCTDYLADNIIPKLVDSMGEYKFLDYKENGSLSYIIKDLFNNSNRPALRNMIYKPSHDMCFAVIDKSWKIKDLEYISNILAKSLIPCIEKLLIFLEVGSDKFDTPEFYKFREFHYYLNQLKKSTMDISRFKECIIREELD